MNLSELSIANLKAVRDFAQDKYAMFAELENVEDKLEIWWTLIIKCNKELETRILKYYTNENNKTTEKED